MVPPHFTRKRKGGKVRFNEEITYILNEERTF